MKILIIGSDSYIAQKYINFDKINIIKGFSRNSVQNVSEIRVNDLSSINENEFVDIDIVLNFAAIVHRPDIKDKNIYDEVNYKLTVLNANKAKKAGVKLFVQLSTIAVYGNVSVISTNSNYNPQNPYSKSKLKADTELLQMHTEDFKVAIIRPPMVYGGGRAPGNMLRLIKLADKGIPLPFKKIDNKRDFIHVLNLIQYLSIVVENKMHGIFLLSDHQPVSTEYLVDIISRFLKKKVALIAIPVWILRFVKILRPLEFDKLFGSLSIETNFLFEDQILCHSVEDGVHEMVEWYLKNKNV